jgi:hypothetical protein
MPTGREEKEEVRGLRFDSRQVQEVLLSHSLLRGRNEKEEGLGAEVRFQTSARGSSLFIAYCEEGTRKRKVWGLRFDSRQVQEVLLYSQFTERKEWERGGFGS